MDDIAKGILNASNKLISKLQLLSAFFDDEVIYKIFIRSQLIHKLFEGNVELDINKLDLFHLQFTESIIELLRKIKKTNEKNLSVLFDEIQLGDDLIARIKESMSAGRNLDADSQKQTQIINQSLYTLYQNLSGYSTDDAFPKNILQFSNQYSSDFFYPISDNFLSGLLEYKLGNVYKNPYGTIEKKLLGLQCKNEFKNKFYCGLKSENFIIEIYNVPQQNEYFIFYAKGKLYLSCPFSTISEIMVTDPYSNKMKIVKELQDKNDTLKNSETALKTKLPEEVKKILVDYYDKIMSIDFVTFINDYDVQANILKAMLNTKIM
jgi:hypothetical protein